MKRYRIRCIETGAYLSVTMDFWTRRVEDAEWWTDQAPAEASAWWATVNVLQHPLRAEAVAAGVEALGHTAGLEPSAEGSIPFGWSHL